MDRQLSAVHFLGDRCPFFQGITMKSASALVSLADSKMSGEWGGSMLNGIANRQ
jgi:hypothetical protein